MWYEWCECGWVSECEYVSMNVGECVSVSV